VGIELMTATNAYYDLMYSIGNLNVQRQSLELAQQSPDTVRVARRTVIAPPSF
jgi:hypothetical protein